MDVAQDAPFLPPAAMAVPPSPSEDMSQKMAPSRERGTPYQVPTPPASDGGSPVLTRDESAPADDNSGNTIVSISTTFHPTSDLLPLQPDTIVISSDGVFFYVHRAALLAKSKNDWNGLLCAAAPRSSASSSTTEDAQVVSCPEPAPVLNVVLHVVYGLSPASYKPTIDVLSAAVDAMATYGLPPKEHIAPSTPLYALILALAPTQPIAAYALAASHDLYALAVPVSSHLLSFPLHAITDELSEKIGPLYLKKLFFLHLGRLEALRQLLLSPPHPHPPTNECSFTDQKSLTRAWALAAAYLAWDTRPDLRASAIEAAFLPLGDRLSCSLCKQSLVERVKHVIVQWSMVKVHMICTECWEASPSTPSSTPPLAERCLSPLIVGSVLVV